MKNNITGRSSIVINAPASRVWKALITPSMIKKYFFGTDAVSTWQPGSPVTFTGEWQGKKYQDKGTILDNEPNKLLRYSYWSSMSGIEDKPENYVNVTYSLLERGGETTTLTITQDNIPDEKMREHSEENWRKVLEGLKELLEKEAVNS